MHPDVEKLIEMASKGEAVTDRQREILRNKAVSLGEDPDEAELLLDLVIKKKKKQEQGQEQEIAENDVINNQKSHVWAGKNANEPLKEGMNQVREVFNSGFASGLAEARACMTPVERTSFTGIFSPVSGTNKSKMVAAVLALFLGGFGVHKFYLGDTKGGFLYLLFFWTMIPMILGWIDCFRYLLESDGAFRRRINKEDADYE